MYAIAEAVDLMAAMVVAAGATWSPEFRHPLESHAPRQPCPSPGGH